MSGKRSMAVLGPLGLACRVIAGILLLLAAVGGVSALWAVDLRANPAIALLYCLLPAATFIAFIVPWGGAARMVLQVVLTAGFLSAYAALNWRTCASLGYCTTIGATLWATVHTTAATQMLVGWMLGAAAVWLEKEQGRP
ncbi:MAG: hypothetical protein P4L40_19775 [Terracidiphilus sp.]|nr:hypothetical protein [Terracidiphilus sp.]